MSLLEGFRTARWVRTANLILQAVLFLTLFLGLNYLAGSQGWSEGLGRFDLTRYGRYSLSPETIAYLRELTSPVRIIVTVAEDNADTDVRGLLREFEYATEGNPDGRISVEYLDIDLRRREAQQLDVDQPGQIVLLCGDNRSTIPIDDLYTYENGQRHGFRGEEKITEALLDVSSARRNKIYFLVGHDALRPDDPDPERGLSAAREQLAERNYQVATLDLGATPKIPDDASALICVEPQSPYSQEEVETLRQFLNVDEGRLILFLAPGYPHGFDPLFSDWGIIVDDDYLRDRGPENETEDGDLIVTDFLPHPITQALLQGRTEARLRVGPTRTVRPDAARAAGNGLDVVTLAASSPTAWGEVDYALRGDTAFRRGIDVRPLPTMDPPGRLGIAVASERAAAKDNLPFSVRSGRLVVFGTGDLIDNARIASPGSLDILLGAINWAVDRDTQLNIRARPVERFQLSLSARELGNLRSCLMFVLPGIAALLGLLVYWARRN